MAIDWESTYPGASAPADANYPEGSAINSSTPTSTDGTPVEKAWVNDIAGFVQRLLNEASIVADNAPDTVQDSQYYNGLMYILTRELGDQALRSFDTVAAMVAATDLNVGDLVITRGYLAASPGVGSALYRVVAAATGTPDGGQFINLNTHQAQLIPGRVVKSSQYGAVGDGSTDDSTEIQALIDGPFKTVEIDTNSKLDTAVTIGSGADARHVIISENIVGGAIASILNVTTSGGPFAVIEFRGGGRITGDAVTTTQDGIYVTNTTGLRIINPVIFGCLDKGINISGTENSVISGGFISGVTQNAGVYITGATAVNNVVENINLSDNEIGLRIVGGLYNHIRNVIADDCVDAGILLSDVASFNEVTGCHCTDQTDSAGAGIRIADTSSDNIIRDCHCTGNAGPGIEIDGTAAGGSEAARNKIINCSCNSNTKAGISIHECLDTEIINCTCRLNTLSGIDTLDSNRPKILGGTMDTNTGNGILHQSSLNTLDQDVNLTNQTGRGVYITDLGSLTPESFLTKNCYFYNNGGFAYQVTGSGLGGAKSRNSRGDWCDRKSGENSVADGGTITHGIDGAAPERVVISNHGNNELTLRIGTIGSTTFSVELYDVVAGTPASGSHNLVWEAERYHR